MTVKRSAFASEVEPWISGQVTASGAYFGQDARDIVHRLLRERLPDDRVANAIGSGAWQAPAFPFNAVLQLMDDGTGPSLTGTKRKDAAIRQAVARNMLSDFAVRAYPRACHLWLELPKPWRSHQFAIAAARGGIALSSAAMFAIREAHAANAVRIALPWLSLPEPRRALDILAQLLRSTPGNVE